MLRDYQKKALIEIMKDHKKGELVDIGPLLDAYKRHLESRLRAARINAVVALYCKPTIMGKIKSILNKLKKECGRWLKR